MICCEDRTLHPVTVAIRPFRHIFQIEITPRRESIITDVWRRGYPELRLEAILLVYVGKGRQRPDMTARSPPEVAAIVIWETEVCLRRAIIAPVRTKAALGEYVHGHAPFIHAEVFHHVAPCDGATV